MNIELQSVEFKNFMSYEQGNFEFNKGIDLIIGQNGSGKCQRKTTEINVDFEDDLLKSKFIGFMKQREQK